MNKNLKPYATTKRRKFFDWNAFLAQTNTSPSDWAKAKVRAASWATCACGNQCDIIPRDDAGAPVDDSLYYLGKGFYDAIDRKHPQLASWLLAEIEKRSSEVIAELLASPISDHVASRPFAHIVG